MRQFKYQLIKERIPRSITTNKVREYTVETVASVCQDMFMLSSGLSVEGVQLFLNDFYNGDGHLNKYEGLLSGSIARASQVASYLGLPIKTAEAIVGCSRPYRVSTLPSKIRNPFDSNQDLADQGFARLLPLRLFVELTRLLKQLDEAELVPIYRLVNLDDYNKVSVPSVSWTDTVNKWKALSLTEGFSNIGLVAQYALEPDGAFIKVVPDVDHYVQTDGEIVPANLNSDNQVALEKAINGNMISPQFRFVVRDNPESF